LNPGFTDAKPLHSRVAAVEACRWATKCVPFAPYVTSLPWVSHYGCKYVVHGDDITSDSNGDDCYRFVKAAGRFKVVKRTPGISTTDLVGRMLLCTKGHFVKSVKATLAGKEGSGSEEERAEYATYLQDRLKDYATDETGLQPGPQVWVWEGSKAAKLEDTADEPGNFDSLVGGKPPKPGQRVIYVDGGFDLFSSGHIEFLRQVLAIEEAEGRERGWYDNAQREQRLKDHGEDYGPAYIVAGVHDDDVINHWKGLNYPIMNIFERALCVLQCRVRLYPWSPY
jgi:ethanolamine-phosphate cytidylyltransferase